MANVNIITSAFSQQLANKLIQGETDSINLMYIEYQIPNDGESYAQPVVDLPTLNPTDTSYYLKLRDNTGSNRDFLRIPIASVTKSTNSDGSISLLFHSIATGDVGVNGKSTKGAIIYGLALIQSTTYGTTVDDITRDTLVARGTWESVNQMNFSQISQTAISYKITLTQ